MAFTLFLCNSHYTQTWAVFYNGFIKVLKHSIKLDNVITNALLHFIVLATVFHSFYRVEANYITVYLIGEFIKFAIQMRRGALVLSIEWQRKLDLSYD